MFNRLSVKIAAILILVMTVIMTLFTIYFVRSRSASMEEELLAKGKLATLAEARAMEAVLTQAIRSNRFTEAEIFDQAYVPIPGTDPRKYHTRYDTYLDGTIQDMEDEYLKDDQVVFAVLNDRNGYVPTHHRKYSLPLTGDREKDKIGNRTKRLFNGPEELAALRSREPFQRQVFHRDTGETMWVLTAPVFVNGRHWGAARVGFSMAKTEKKIAALRNEIVISMLLMLAISIVTILLLVNRSIRPLLRLTHAARRITDGDLDGEVPVESRDEIGILAEAFNRMTTVIVRNLREEIEKNNRLIASIKRAIIQLSSSTSEMMAVSAQQSAGASQQVAAVKEVSATAAEIAVTAKQITANAGSVEAIARQSSRSATAGTLDVSNAIAGMGRLRDQVQNIAASMLELGDDSQKIGGIIEIICEISDQTNLLALNAAIEAAGAGEGGKRFAIVAHEVKRLAERTVEATRQIKGIIGDIQRRTNYTIMTTEEGTKAVDAAAILVDQVQASFGAIQELVEQTNRAAREIVLSTQQQTSACELMATTMAGVDEVAQQAAGGARETEQAISEITELVQSLRQLAGEG
jgi:methyl-accepting chemotaxis protein